MPVDASTYYPVQSPHICVIDIALKGWKLAFFNTVNVMERFGRGEDTNKKKTDAGNWVCQCSKAKKLTARNAMESSRRRKFLDLIHIYLLRQRQAAAL